MPKIVYSDGDTLEKRNIDIKKEEPEDKNMAIPECIDVNDATVVGVIKQEELMISEDEDYM